jgi:hypothetical protein
VTVFVPLVVNHAPTVTGDDGEHHTVTFETGAIGALLVYPTREAAEKAEPGKRIMTMELLDAPDAPPDLHGVR